MDKTTLVDIDIVGGKTLLEALKTTELDINAALWIYMIESDEWRMVIASSLVDEFSSRKAYYIIHSQLKKSEPEIQIPLRSILAVGLDHYLVYPLLSADKETKQNLTNKWVNKSVINGEFIEAGYIYWIQ